LLLALPLLSAGCPGPPEPLDEIQFVRPKPHYVVHDVRKGETLYSIGKAYGVPWHKIEKANGFNPKSIKIGTPLLIPLHERTADPQPPPTAPASLVSQTPQPQDTPREIRPVAERLLHRGRPSRRFWWPTDGKLVRRYGASVRDFAEPGVGMSAPAGTEVCAAASGTVICVVRAGRSPRAGWGNVVSIRHDSDVVSWYGYLDQVLVKQGQRVSKGQRIGSVGSSGAAGQPELALRFFLAERPVDPLRYLP